MSVTAPIPSILGSFIASLRTNAVIFDGRVAGAAEFYRGLQSYNPSLVLPAAFVLPLGQDAEPNTLLGNDLQQIVHKGVGIAVELDAQRDRRGQDPAMIFEVVEAQIMASCLNMFIGECRMSRGSYFTGSRYLDLDRARLWYQWEFGLDWQITDEDGVQPADPGIPLEALDVNYYNQIIADPPGPAVVQHLITVPTRTTPKEIP